MKNTAFILCNYFLQIFKNVYVWRVETLTCIEISFFCLNSHFWCWQKSHCSSPLVIKDFGGAVSPLVDPDFTGNFPISAIKKWLVCRKPTFSRLLNIFLTKYHHPLPSSFQHPWNPKQNKAYIFPKPTFQKITHCHQIQTLWKI